MDTHELYDEKLKDMIEETVSLDIQSSEFTNAAKNLKLFSECRTLMPEPEDSPNPVPVTRWEKIKASTSAVWDNETTRVAIKAGGAFGGVLLVVYTTIHKDHVIERQSMAQANQTPK